MILLKEILMAGENMKILTLIPDRLIKATGGMGENFNAVAEYLSTQGHEFSVVGFPLEGAPRPKVKEYREVFNPLPSVSSALMNTMTCQIAYFTEAIKCERPDVVYVYDWSIYLAGIHTAKYFNVPLVSRMCLSPTILGQIGYTFGLDLSKQGDKAIHDSFCAMEKRGLTEANHVVHISENHAKYFKGFESSIVPNGIDLEKYQSLKPFILPGDRRLKVVYIGRLTEVKGIIPLCQAKVPPEIDLIFIGALNIGEPYCMRMIKEKVLNSSNVYYLGSLHEEDKRRALLRADSIIVPSLYEAFGLVGLEGFASKSIVISSRAFGLGDFLTEDCSIFCGTTPDEITNAFIKLTNLSSSEKAEMVRKGLEKCDRYSTVNSAELLLKVFQNELSF